MCLSCRYGVARVGGCRTCGLERPLMRYRVSSARVMGIALLALAGALALELISR
jgi:hypothetical protein